jgi:threonine aldolase
VAANGGHAGGYGADPQTVALDEVVRHRFGTQAVGFPVFGGTGANVVALAALTGRWQAIVCADIAHVNTDEGAAPEHAAGVKLVPVPAPGGRITTDALAEVLADRQTVHQSALRVLSLTQASELGTVYTPDEIAALADLAHAHGLLVHVDGARLANAAAALGASLADVSLAAGADVVCVGGTKNGLAFGELVVTGDQRLADRVERARKGLAQLASKQRFLAAQLVALYGGELWHELAVAANRAAADVAAQLAPVPGVRIAYPVEANAVFLRVPDALRRGLAEQFGAQTFFVAGPLVRLVCSWDTTPGDVQRLVAFCRSPGTAT